MAAKNTKDPYLAKLHAELEARKRELLSEVKEIDAILKAIGKVKS